MIHEKHSQKTAQHLTVSHKAAFANRHCQLTHVSPLAEHFLVSMVTNSAKIRCSMPSAKW